MNMTTAKQASRLIQDKDFSINTCEQSLTMAQMEEFAKEYLRVCKESHNKLGNADPMGSILIAENVINKV